MDPLSDVLALLKPQSYRTVGFDVGGDWAVRFDNQTGRIKCYAVASGTCWLVVDGGGEPIRLTTGDCFVVPSGHSFMLASDVVLPPIPAHVAFAGARHGGVVVQGGGGGTFLTGTRFEVGGRNAPALLAALPPVIHLDTAEDRTALRWSIERMTAEMREGRPGASLVAHHLAHLMLLQALRLYLARQADGLVGWFHALADPQLSAAFGAMHADPARRWTVGELAAGAGLSRSVFAERFRDRVGEAPIAYLTRWRMMLAAERLTSGREPLGKIARALGYESANAFSTAFQRQNGCSPRRYAQAEKVGAASNS